MNETTSQGSTTRKTSILITGEVWAKQVYTNKDGKEYHSVDLLVDGHKNMVNVRLPDNYDSTKLKPREIVPIPVIFVDGKYGASLNAVA